MCINFIRQNLTSKYVWFWHIKTVPALKGLKLHQKEYIRNQMDKYVVCDMYFIIDTTVSNHGTSVKWSTQTRMIYSVLTFRDRYI